MKAADHAIHATRVMPLVPALVCGGLFILPWGVVGMLTPLALPEWVHMAGIAAAIFFALKVLTLAGHWREAASGRGVVYLVAWPGLNAPAVLGKGAPARLPAVWSELVVALAKLVLGLGLIYWAVLHARTGPVWGVGWAGMVGIIFAFHFGVMHAASWIWRRAGLNTPPIMRAPLLAVSLAEFWGERWNVAFADVARRFVFRPLARRWGVLRAGGVVFLVSGLVHEAAISLPAGGGWGGPTLYFALHAAGIAIERSRAGVAVGLGRGVRGWLWVFAFTVLPLPLLFHAPFVGRVIVPMLKDFNLLIP